MNNNIVLTCFLRNMFNHYSPTLHSYKWCGAATKKCRTRGYNCAGEIPTFVKSKLEGMAHTIHLLTAQNSAAKRSVSEVESSAQELLHCSLEFIVMRRKGLRLTTNLRNKNSLHTCDCV